jgi:uncharacterized protein (TIGR00661 family)
MRILFGVQGTGNGHLSRAREIIRHLVRFVDVDVLISGTRHDVDLGLAVQTHYAHGLGFEFGTRGGIAYWNTLQHLRLLRLLQDIRHLPLQHYDAVVSDFEPISAWSAYLRKRPCIALSHQAAFASPRVPRPRHRHVLAEWVMRWYAPGSQAIGFHFQRYDDFIETPIIRQAIREASLSNNGHYTVYLPMFDAAYLMKRLTCFSHVRWEIFSTHYKNASPYTRGNVTVSPVTADAFVHSLASCEGLLTAAGFETASETLFCGKKLLVIPMKGQYEQQCNAEALRRMGVRVSPTLDEPVLRSWLEQASPLRCEFRQNVPDVVEVLLHRCHMQRHQARPAWMSGAEM